VSDAKGQLPKAYLRLDPNIDRTHEAPSEMLLLICEANRQPRRGRFKNVTVLRRVLGPSKARRAMNRHDVITLREHDPEDCPLDSCDGGADAEPEMLYLDGWDQWQEGDITVGERQRRIRGRPRSRNGVTPPSRPRNDRSVTPPLHNRAAPSEAPAPEATTPPAGRGVRQKTPASAGSLSPSSPSRRGDRRGDQRKANGADADKWGRPRQSYDRLVESDEDVDFSRPEGSADG